MASRCFDTSPGIVSSLHDATYATAGLALGVLFLLHRKVSWDIVLLLVYLLVVDIVDPLLVEPDFLAINKACGVYMSLHGFAYLPALGFFGLLFSCQYGVAFLRKTSNTVTLISLLIKLAGAWSPLVVALAWFFLGRLF